VTSLYQPPYWRNKKPYNFNNDKIGYTEWLTPTATQWSTDSILNNKDKEMATILINNNLPGQML
jgi:hypothetical protein